MANWCEYFAERARSEFSGLTVYSNVDPTREWNGAPTLEFNEPDEPTTRTLLSGAALTDRTVYAIVRAASTTDLEAFQARVLDFCVSTCDALQRGGAAYAWSIGGSGVSADSRGIVEGESFYGYVELTLTEIAANGSFHLETTGATEPTETTETSTIDPNESENDDVSENNND